MRVCLSIESRECALGGICWPDEERCDRFKVIGGDLADRLIPVPLSKTPTDQAVRWLVVVCVYINIDQFYALAINCFGSSVQLSDAQCVRIFIEFSLWSTVNLSRRLQSGRDWCQLVSVIEIEDVSADAKVRVEYTRSLAIAPRVIIANQHNSIRSVASLNAALSNGLLFLTQNDKDILRDNIQRKSVF